MVVVAALLAIFAGCKAESPTAPPSVGSGGTGGAGNPPSGGVTPPVGANIILTVSNPNPLTNSVTTISATVTQNGTLVPNGTAVEFVTDVGTFTDTQDVKTIRTTTNGVASAVLTNSSAGVATVTVTVNNVTKTVKITFTDVPIIIPPPSTVPTIGSVSPTTGPPAGGTVVTITGTNFRTPVRVVFDAGPAGVKEAFVNQNTVTPTQIIAVTPKIDLVSTQTQAAAITVIVDAGNPTEARASKSAAFTYVTTNLTPVIRFISPTSGPIDGGTQVTITGDAFESPVQVFFGSAQAQVISVGFNQIIVMSPTARDTNPNATGTVTGPVAVKVLNGNSGKSVTLNDGFRYIPKMQITTVAPLLGSALGGTDVKIDGTGFNEPVSVFIGGALAQVLKVTGTEILARTGKLASPCGNGSGPIIVTNTDNGDTATAPAIYVFQYVGVLPVITSITSSSTPPVPGNSLSVGVQNPGVGLLGSAVASFKVGDQAAVVTPTTITTGTGTQTFTVVVPNLPASSFPTVACTVGPITGTQLGTAAFGVVFTNVTTSCVSAPVQITIGPPGTNPCVLPPPPTATVTAPATGCADAGSVVAAGTVTATATITIANTGGQPLTIAANPPISGTNAGDFTISPTTARTVAPATSATYTITFDPSAVGPRSATVTFTTNDPVNPTVTVCLTGTGT
jgi:hypothetical protein